MRNWLLDLGPATVRAVALVVAVVTVLPSTAAASSPGATTHPPGALEFPASDPAVLAARIAAHQFPSGTSTVVLARSDAYPDALAGAPLAASLDAPILLTAPSRLEPAVRDEIARLGAERVVVLGGHGAVSDGVVDELRRAGVSDIERVAGADRFQTAALIADAVRSSSGSRDVILVEGAHADPGRGWPDAVAVSAEAARLGVPILLTVRDTLPPVTEAYLRARPVDLLTAIGGDAAISGDVVATAGRHAARTDRLAGANRFATSALVADHALAAGADPSRVWLASGRSFHAALIAAPAAAREGATLLLVDPDNPFGLAVSRTWIETNLPEHPRTLGAVDLDDIPRPADGEDILREQATFTVQSPEQPWSQHLTATIDRFEVRLGDRWRNDAGLVNRAEVNGRDPVPYDTDVWLSFWMRVSGQVPETWTILGQFHATGDPLDISASPVWAQQLNGDRFRVLVRGSDADPLLVNPPAVAVYEGAVSLGTWQHFTYRLRFSRGGDGLVQAWKDHIEIVPETRVAMGYDDEAGPRFKYGIYRREAAASTVVEYGTVRLSTTPPPGQRS